MSTKHNSICLEKAGDEEPIFVLRAQDELAPIIVELWAKLASTLGTSNDKVLRAQETAKQMQQWQLHNPSKIPD